MFKFLHAADIHLDSPMRGLEKYEGAPLEAMRNATQRALRNMVDLAISEEVKFILISGDLYDGDWRDYRTGLFFAKEMSRLREAAINVFIVFGNHDAASQITKRLDNMPKNVIHFPTKSPDSFFLKEAGVVIHGRGFPTRAVTEDLSAAYPDAVPGLYNIGMLHSCATGREGHEPYAPCSIDKLLSKHYHYWALGHVHKREILHQDPWIVFPGNIQGRHIRETGPKGCTLVTVEGSQTISVEERSLDALRWEISEINCSGLTNPDEVLELIAADVQNKSEAGEDIPLVVRVVLSGASRVHQELSINPEKWTNEIRARLTDETGGRVGIERIRINTRQTKESDRPSESKGPLWSLLTSLRNLEKYQVAGQGLTDDERELREMVADDLTRLKARLPLELRAEGGEYGLDSTETFKEALQSAGNMLFSMLSSEGGEK
ncbi:MAG: DNA repair exonuclease [Deltaproteobacteria bacterium]|nr:DNA repair exonuclease [Deltaproteobacteria bacterium]